jgi:hypothetical protein
MELTDSQVRLEWLVLADSAEVVNNKLYMLGGGWELYMRNGPQPVSFAIAASFHVPWNATNLKHTFEIQVVNEDAQQTVLGFGGEFEVGRPPGMPAGSGQRTQLATKADADLAPATYAIRCLVDGVEADRQLTFRVVAGPNYEAAGPPN